MGGLPHQELMLDIYNSPEDKFKSMPQKILKPSPKNVATTFQQLPAKQGNTFVLLSLTNFLLIKQTLQNILNSFLYCLIQ